MTGTAEARGIPQALADFGFRLSRQIPSEGNVFFSPLSVGSALAALVPGARSDTLAELAHVLGLPAEPVELQAEMPHLLEALGPRTSTEETWDRETDLPRTQEIETYRLTLATALFVEEAYPLQTAFCDVLGHSFLADFFSLHFVDRTGAVRSINRWVEGKTEGRIKRLVSADDIAPDTRLVLANAVYFKARWSSQFSEHQTEPRTFHLPPGADSRGVEVPMMQRTGTYQYLSDPSLGLEALRIPYDEGLSMLALLPAEGRFREVEEAMSVDLIGKFRAEASATLVSLALPRFELRSAFNLRAALTKLGLTTAFDRERADFGGITPSSEGLCLSEALHQAWVRIDERGTEAAAATAIMALAAGIPETLPEPVPFVVDRPFLFLIQDERTGAVLFLGRVLDPTEGAA